MSGEEESLYEILGVAQDASKDVIKQKYRELVKANHPDKGGSKEFFDKIYKAYAVLSNETTRADYDKFGNEAIKELTPEEIFAQKFEASKTEEKKDESTMHSFARAVKNADVQDVIVHSDEDTFTAGFDAWMRNRDPKAFRVVTADVLMDKYGIEATGYDPIPLPPLKAHVIRYKEHGDSESVLFKTLEPIPTELKWQEVLVQILATPINPADTFAIEGYNDSNESKFPRVAGNDGVGVVLKVGPGVENLHAQDWVIPIKPGLGTWRTLGVFRERDLLAISPDMMSEEYASCIRILCTAFRLLEDFVTLKPGDSIIQSAANSAVGQAVIQICKVLRISTINIVRDRDNFEETKNWLQTLGANVVVRSTDYIQKALNEKNVPIPRLGLDCVGGQTASTIANSLRNGSTLVIYGGVSRKSVTLPTSLYIFKDIRVRGFRFNQWVEDHPDKFLPMIEALYPLLKAGKCQIATEEYELGSHFATAIERNKVEKRSTKIILKVKDNIGETY